MLAVLSVLSGHDSDSEDQDPKREIQKNEALEALEKRIKIQEQNEKHLAEKELRNRIIAATIYNMPAESAPTERKDWPPVWIAQFKRQAREDRDVAEEKRQHDNRPYRTDLGQAAEFLGLLHLLSRKGVSLRPDQYDYTEESDVVLQAFENSMSDYHVDKMDQPGSNIDDPYIKDRENMTQDIRRQAWQARVQQLKKSRDHLIAAIN